MRIEETGSGQQPVEAAPMQLYLAMSVAARLVTAIADNGQFGNVCVGRRKDMETLLSNSGFNTLKIGFLIALNSFSAM